MHKILLTPSRAVIAEYMHDVFYRSPATHSGTFQAA